MKSLIFCFCLFLILLSCSQMEGHSQPQPILLSETEEIITRLASDDFEGRQSGTPSYDKAVTYAISLWKESGILPYYSSYRDTFEVRGKESYNVVATLEEIDPNQPYVLIGAHLDHIGMTYDSTDSVFNGANDNASGSTAVLQIAKALKGLDFEQNVIFVLFGAEEQGLTGSKHLAERFKKEGVNLSYMLNFEMIGQPLTAGQDKVYVTGYNMSDIASVANKLMGREFVVFFDKAEELNLFHRSDNAPFYKTLNIPAHTFSSFDFQNYDYYHKAKDEVTELDIPSMNSIINSSAQVIAKMLRSGATVKLNPEKEKIGKREKK